jgi:hypothetical protein
LSLQDKERGPRLPVVLSTPKDLHFPFLKKESGGRSESVFIPQAVDASRWKINFQKIAGFVQKI